MDDSVGVPSTSEGLSVVTSLSDVSEHIAIAEHIPTEHETANAVFHSGEVSNEVVEHEPCHEVQVVKVANVSLTFSTPSACAPQTTGAETHIQVATSSLTPIQEVIDGVTSQSACSPQSLTTTGAETHIQVATSSLTPIQEVIDGVSSPAPSGSSLHEAQDINDIQQQEQDEDQQNIMGHNMSHSRRTESQNKAWEQAMQAEVLQVRCRNETAELHKSKLGSGGRGKCIKYNGQGMSPSEFEARCGRASSKDWKRSIRYGGRTLQSLIEEGILVPHAVSCTCATCCDDDTLAGPVRLFVPYKRRKREASQSGSPVLKKSMSLSSENAAMKREGSVAHMHGMMVRSISVDSAGGQYVAAEAIDTSELPPGVVTVNSVSTAIPVTTLTPLTQAAMVATPLHGTQALSGVTFALPTFTAITTDASLDQRRNWWHIEEMINSLISTAQQLKTMVEQAKLQSDAARDAAVAQAKMQAEAEKKEAVAQSRMNSLLQLSRTLQDARAEKEAAVAQALAHASAAKMEAVADARQEQFLKSFNGGGEAECSAEAIDPDLDKSNGID